jgi:acetate kinase
MGLTPLDGLPMATRCGSIDPGIVLYLIEGLKMSPAEVGAMLSTKSGLLGLSGISSDMRELLASSAPEAAEAVAFYCYRIARELGSLVAALGGLDALVFTGGIGENAAPVRAQVCERAAWLGVKLDPRANALAAPASDPAASSASGPPTGPVPRALHAPESAVAVFVVAADEEGVIARHTARIVTEGGNGMAGR